MNGFETGRQRAANYIMICNNIADSYPFGIAHGLQKDAIQNAIDARQGRKTVFIKFDIVVNTIGRLLTITDSNTSGLTGPILANIEEYEEDLPEDYHWARFESFAFTKESPEAIGARGQGKFIFLSASNCYTMYYDTLRADGIYRVGGTMATRTGCPILPGHDEKSWEGENGVMELMKRCGLEPINDVGTRVIVLDPIDELLDQLSNGGFLKAIQETWFREIEKKRLSITIGGRTNPIEVDLPDLYPLPNKDSRKYSVWVLGRDFHDDEIQLAMGERFKIKNFHAVYFKKGTIPEDFRGIAIIHNGMKITSLDMISAPQNIRERITGYIEFDRPLDHELRKGENQSSNHYNLKWRRKLPYAIKGYVNQQLNAFGKTKLGIGSDPREVRNRRRTFAEEWAMRQLMKFARDLDLFGAKGIKRPFPVIPPPPPKIIGVAINNFTFPDPEISPRVNRDHNLIDIRITAYNRTKESPDVSLLVQVLHGDTSVLQPFERKQFTLRTKKPISFGPFDIKIDNKHFSEPGRYRLNATLFDLVTGDKIDGVSRIFWVEKDPPLRQPFVLQPLSEFPEPNQFRQWLIGGSINNSPILYYNTSHPAYRLIEDNDDELGDYIFQIALEGAIQFILNRPNKEDGNPDFHPLLVENIIDPDRSVESDEIPSRTQMEIARYISEIRWHTLEGE